ncbi:MAG: hypothetical protein ACJ0PV_03235 [Flavobacteriaceae bacterium]
MRNTFEARGYGVSNRDRKRCIFSIFIDRIDYTCDKLLYDLFHS